MTAHCLSESQDTPLTVAADEGYDEIVSFLSGDMRAELEKKKESGRTSPYQNIFLQEMTVMNNLRAEIMRSL